MQSMSQTTGYAIEALACVAADAGDFASVQRIAESASIPPPYLAKIVNRLVQAGILHSKRGYRGGICLARDPSDIRLIEIDQALGGKRSWDEEPKPPLEVSPLSETAERARCFWDDFQRDLQRRLEELTLADVLREREVDPERQPSYSDDAVTPI